MVKQSNPVLQPSNHDPLLFSRRLAREVVDRERRNGGRLYNKQAIRACADFGDKLALHPVLVPILQPLLLEL